MAEMTTEDLARFDARAPRASQRVRTSRALAAMIVGSLAFSLLMISGRI